MSNNVLVVFCVLVSKSSAQTTRVFGARSVSYWRLIFYQSLCRSHGFTTEDLCITSLLDAHLLVVHGNAPLDLLGLDKLGGVQHIEAVKSPHPLHEEVCSGLRMLLKGIEGRLSVTKSLLARSLLVLLLNRNGALQHVLDGLDLQLDAVDVVAAQSRPLVVLLYGDYAPDLLESILSFEVLLALSFTWDVLVQIAREDAARRILVETAATELAHESREGVSRLLNYEENDEESDAC